MDVSDLYLALELVEPSFVLKLFICAKIFCSLELQLVWWSGLVQDLL